MLCQLSETALVHLVPTPEKDALLLGTKHIVFLADGALLPQCIRHVFVLTELGLVNARLTLRTVLEILTATLLANSTLVTVKVLLLDPICIVEHTF